MEDRTSAEMIMLIEIKKNLNYEGFYFRKRLDVIQMLLITNYVALIILLFYILWIK